MEELEQKSLPPLPLFYTCYNCLYLIRKKHMQNYEIIGTTQHHTVENKLIVFPFSKLSILSEFNKDFIDGKELYVVYENKVSTKITYKNNEIIEQNQTSSDGKHKLFTKNMLNEYVSKGSVPKEHPEDVYLYITEKELKHIYEQGFFSLQGNLSEKTTFNPPIVDDEKYCCIKFFRAFNRYFIQTEDNRFFTEPLNLNTYYTSSAFWNIEGLLENLIKNKQFVFLYENGSSLEIVDTENPDHLRKIITRTPHYNQNDDGNQEEFSCYYILNNDEVKAAIQNEQWAMSLYGHNETILDEKDRRNMFQAEELQILSFVSDGLKHYHTYQSLLAEKYTEQHIEKPKKNKFR